MARIPTCNYIDCNGIRCSSVGIYALPVAKRGGRNAFFCANHLFSKEGYCDENSQIAGVEKKNGFTFSMENETSFSDAIARMELIDVGFIPTSDCTVDCEYKSPIYEGLNALSKHCATIERLMRNGDLGIGNGCGSHLHVGHRDHINRETMKRIREYYHAIFLPLCEEMQAQGERKTAAFWGRNFTGYADIIDANSYPEDHSNFINVQHNPTIEFRLAKFRNADQYMAVVKFARDTVNAIINNFILHYDDIGVDNIDQHRKHKAHLAGTKIVKLYRKCTANI